jgi:hypothetical protein
VQNGWAESRAILLVHYFVDFNMLTAALLHQRGGRFCTLVTCPYNEKDFPQEFFVNVTNSA